MLRRSQKPMLLIFVGLAAVLVGCAGGSEPREEGPRAKRASELVKDYDGQPKVRRVGPLRTAPPKQARHLIYVTEEGRRGGARRIRSVVYTDGSAIDFVNNKKNRPALPKGSVTPISPAGFDNMLAKLNGFGFDQLPSTSYPLKIRVPKVRAIHLVEGGRRVSVVKEKLAVAGGAGSPRAVFTKCEMLLIRGH